MHRISMVLATLVVLSSAAPSLAQEDTGAGFGALVGGLVGGAIGAAVSGRAPRAADLIPGHPGGGGARGKGGGGAAHGGAHAAPAAAHAGGGQVRRKPGK